MKHFLELFEHVPETCPVCGAEMSSMGGREDMSGMARAFDLTPKPGVTREYECGTRISANTRYGIENTAPLVTVDSGCKGAVRRALSDGKGVVLA